MTDHAIKALVTLFVDAHHYKLPLGQVGADIEDLANELNVDVTADADTIEMAIRHELWAENMKQEKEPS